jgi:hypothetical protein
MANLVAFKNYIVNEERYSRQSFTAYVRRQDSQHFEDNSA